MPNIPSHIRLQSGVTDVSDSARVRFWLQQEEGTYERIGTKRQPEAIDLGKGMEGVAVTVSTWQKIIRSWYGKVLSSIWHNEDPAVIKDSIPSTSGDIEVQRKMEAGIEALLAWTKNGVVNLDIPHLYSLGNEVTGHELLGENICLIRGKFHGGKSSATKIRMEPVTHSGTSGDLKNTMQQYSFVEYVESFVGVTETEPPVASPILLFDTTNVDPHDPYLRFVHSVLEQFPQHLSVADALQKKSQLQVSPSQKKEVFASLEALHEASEKGISSTQLFLPKDLQGIVSLIVQQHGAVKDRRLSDKGVYVQGEIFRLLHLLREHECEHILDEGTAYGGASDAFAFQRQMADIPVPYSTEQIYSSDGQALLCAHPDKLHELIRRANTVQCGEASYIIWGEQFPFFEGAEDPLTRQTLKEHMAEGQRYSALCEKLNELVPQYEADALSDTQELQSALEYWCPLHLAKARNHAAREQFTILLSNAMMNEHVPHIVFGAAHLYQFLKEYADRHIGVFVTVPSSFDRTCLITDFSNVANERDTLYTYALHVLNKIRGADSKAF